MTSRNADRLISVARRAVPWVVGPAALAMRERSVELVRPSVCPGALELISIGAVRASPDLRIGPLFAVLHAAVFILAIAAFVTLAGRWTRNIAVAAAAGFAVAVSPLFTSPLAPPVDVAAFGMCAAAALTADSLLRGYPRSPYGRCVLGAGVALLSALVVPPWLMIAAIGAAAAGVLVATRARDRWQAGVANAAALIVVALGILSLSTPAVLAGPAASGRLTACVLPSPSAAGTIAALGTIGWWLGPFALGLATLGAFAAASRVAARRGACVITAAAACVVLAAGARMTPQVAAAPLVVALWWLAALGLENLISAFPAGSGRRVAAVLILLLVPALQASRRVTEQRDDRVRPRGHDSQTLRRTTAMLDVAPQDVSFVEEDASVDILLRASVFGGRRRSKPVRVIPQTLTAVADTVRAGRVYAFPQQQEDLSLRGFVVDPIAAVAPGSRAFEGMGAITGTRGCQAVGATWADLPPTSGRIALSADRESAQGPVLMYYGGDAPPQPAAGQWPPRTLRGFHASTFDRDQAPVADRVRDQARDEKVAADHPLLRRRFVVRLGLHRIPRAPLALAVTLGAPFPVGVTRFEQGAAAVGHFTVCDAPAVAIAPLPHQD